MTPTEPVVIVGVGARTPVGFTAAASAAAVRAGISVIEDHPFMIDRFGEPMRVTRDIGLEASLSGPERAVTLALDPARVALSSLAGAKTTPVSILLATPEPRPGQLADHGAAIFDGLAAELAAEVPLGRSGLLAAGHAGGLLALLRARAALLSGEAQLCLVGGVDSYLEPETLEWLDETEQLHSEGNIYGYCPGEGAGFVLLATHVTARALGLQPLLELLAVGAAREENRVRSETVCLGVGLGQALRSAFEQAAVGLPNRILCDMNGERYRGNEYGFAVLRNPGRFRDAAAFEAPADSWGDLGAATGPLLVALANEAHARDYAPGPLSLLWASSEGGARAAALLRGPAGGTT